MGKEGFPSARSALGLVALLVGAVVGVVLGALGGLVDFVSVICVFSIVGVRSRSVVLVLILALVLVFVFHVGYPFFFALGQLWIAFPVFLIIYENIKFTCRSGGRRELIWALLLL